MYRILVVGALGWTFACAGPATAPTTSSPDVVAPAPPIVRPATVYCCRTAGVQGFVHEPLWDAAMCQNVGTWVEGRECEPSCCCKNERVDAPFVRSTADWCADSPERTCLALDDAQCPAPAP